MRHLTWFVLFITASAFALQGVDGDAQRVFRVHNDTPQHATGGYCMHRGIDVDLRGDFQAAIFILDRQ